MFYLYLVTNVNDKVAGMGQDQSKAGQSTASCPADKAKRSTDTPCISAKTVVVQTPSQKAASGSAASIQKKKASPVNSVSSKTAPKVKAQSPVTPVQPNVGKKLTPFLKHVESDLTLKVNETKKNVEIMENLLKFLMEQMKGVDELFASLYRKIFYTGSYYDGLRISSASEFDLNIVLALPFKQADRDVQAESNCPAYSKYQLKTPATELIEKMSKKPPTGLAKFFDKKNYLLPEKIRSWLQSVLDKALVQRKTEIDKFCQNNGVKEIKPKQSGPARTLLIKTRSGGEIDIDLVPVIEFSFPEWPIGAEKHVPLNANNGIWFLVPKPYFKGSAPLEPKDEDVPRLWRLHFPLVERQLLKSLGYVKPLIKFLKKLRDEENWKALASYYLKTFVMREVLHSNAEKWSGELGDLFLELLRTLSKKVKDHSLQYLFYSKYNLLRSMSQDQANNISNRIEKIIASIEKNPRAVLTHLGCTCPNVLPTL